MSTSDLIAITSAIVSVIALFYSWQSNTKKYELTEQYRKNVLEWFESTTKILIKLKMMTEADCLDEKDRLDWLSQLSSQIEIGRFFFPNIIKNDSHGSNKPMAYQGYRHIVLEFLVFSYNIFERKDAKKYLLHAEELRRHFTSCIYELLQPVKFNKLIGRNTKVVFSNDIALDEFLKKDPKSYIFYS